MIAIGTWFLVTILCYIHVLVGAVDQRLVERITHVSKGYSMDEVAGLASLADRGHLENLIEVISVPRVVGTPSHKVVKEFIINSMMDLDWVVTTDRFNDTTPNMGVLQFENIIASLNPNARRFLVLACHYDSKYEPVDYFEGAVDSAVPCAMMINLAYTMRNVLNSAKNEDSLSLMFIFFDGEEPFKSWADNDSLYGARHLARKWSHTSTNNRKTINGLHSLDLLVLLDLIGSSNPAFYSYFEETDHWHSLMVQSEESLANMGFMEDHATNYFKMQRGPPGVQDDHLPFLHRGVPVLHLIPHPFPTVWHTPQDTKDNLDVTAVENLNKILRVFVASFLRL